MAKRKQKATAKAKSEQKAKSEKLPPFDIEEQWLMPQFTYEGSNRSRRLSTRPIAFDLELLGKVAARLLVGEEYVQAAHRAHMLLLACKALNNHVTNENDALKKHVAELNESDLPQVVPFERAIRFITNQDRTDRALPFFRKLFEIIYWYPDAADQSAHMEEMKERGFTKAYVLYLGHRFESDHKAGLLPIRKSPIKKSLLENSEAQNGTKDL